LNERSVVERDQLPPIGGTGFVQTAQQRIDLIGVLPAGRRDEVGRMEQQVDDRAEGLAPSARRSRRSIPTSSRSPASSAIAQARLEQAKARAAANDLSCAAGPTRSGVAARTSPSTRRASPRWTS